MALLHEHRGRLFEDDVADAFDWSLAETGRVVGALVEAGEVDRRDASGAAVVARLDEAN